MKLKYLSRISLLLAVCFVGGAVNASDIVKANNATALINASSWVGGVAPTNTDTAVFSDTYAQSGAVNLSTGGQLEWNGIRVEGSAVTYQIQLQNGNLNWVGVGAGGIDMSSAPRNLLIGSLNVSASQTWITKAGASLQIGRNTSGSNSGRRLSGSGDITVAGNGLAQVMGTDGGKLFNGNFIIQSGATLQMMDSAAYGTTAGGITIQSGGTLNNNANNDARGETIYVEGTGDGAGAIQETAATAQALFSDVRLTGDASFGGLQRFDIGLPPGGTETNIVLDLAGHTLTKTGNNQIQLKGGVVTGGNLDVSSGILGFETGLTVAGSGTINLRNGGTLVLYRASAGSPLNISRPMVFDDGAYLHWTGQKTSEDIDATVNSPISLSGAALISVDGAAGSAIELAGPLSGTAAGFYKLGANTLLLSGTNTYTGTAEVDGGTLMGVTGGSSDGSTVHVLDVAGAAFGALVQDTSRPWSCSGLTLDGANSGLVFNFGNAVTPSTTTAPLQVNGDVSFGGASVVTVQAGAIPAGIGSYPLLTWTGNLSGTAPTLVALPPHIQGNLSVVENTLYLNVTANGQPLSWADGNGTWDIGASPNWQDATGSSGQYYLETTLPGDSVLFGDLPGAGNYTVTLDSTVTPAKVTVSNTLANYVITGSGTIAGPAALVKGGSGTLVLGNSANTYQGGTWVGTGTLEAAVDGSLGTGNVTVGAGATLQLDTPATMNQAASLTLADGTARANLNFTGTQTVASLSFDGGVTQAAAGTWGSVGLGATHESASLTGTGLLEVASITPVSPIHLGAQVSGGTLTLSWPDVGWYVQSNSVDIANSNYWFDIPGSEAGTNFVGTINSSQSQVFYRLRHP